MAPRVLRRDGFNQVVEDLADHAGEDINSLAPGDATSSFSEHPHERPVCLQAFVPPHLDLRQGLTLVPISAQLELFCPPCNQT